MFFEEGQAEIRQRNTFGATFLAVVVFAFVVIMGLLVLIKPVDIAYQALGQQPPTYVWCAKAYSCTFVLEDGMYYLVDGENNRLLVRDATLEEFAGNEQKRFVAMLPRDNMCLMRGQLYEQVEVATLVESGFCTTGKE